MTFHVPIFRKRANAQQHCVQIPCTEFHLNLIKMWIVQIEIYLRLRKWRTAFNEPIFTKITAIYYNIFVDISNIEFFPNRRKILHKSIKFFCVTCTAWLSLEGFLKNFATRQMYCIRIFNIQLHLKSNEDLESNVKICLTIRSKIWLIALNFVKLIITGWHDVEIFYTACHPNGSRNMEITCRNLFKPLPTCEAWPSLLRFSRKSRLIDNIFNEIQQRNFMEIQQNSWSLILRQGRTSSPHKAFFFLLRKERLKASSSCTQHLRMCGWATDFLP
jgi:hypothetical protein